MGSKGGSPGTFLPCRTDEPEVARMAAVNGTHRPPRRARPTDKCAERGRTRSAKETKTDSVSDTRAKCQNATTTDEQPTYVVCAASDTHRRAVAISYGIAKQRIHATLQTDNRVAGPSDHRGRLAVSCAPLPARKLNKRSTESVQRGTVRSGRPCGPLAREHRAHARCSRRTRAGKSILGGTAERLRIMRSNGTRVRGMRPSQHRTKPT